MKFQAADIAKHGLAEGGRAGLRSRHGAVVGVVQADETLRPGTVSLTHGFGGLLADGDAGMLERGASVARLVGRDDRDPVTGMPRLSGIPVTLHPVG
ncbi:molybdopterin dinucleotide binding domain-containing protein [Azospirillum agricola]|uniref:molybdopterin dinucleotide binding domain-containing protein n=1 Tax=Azospirillum agricola TaxID=1720247 RepID=UPI000A1CC805|nr:molybdopterin dinucleotide binding domain-containing protein [Azospirillum agricola]